MKKYQIEPMPDVTSGTNLSELEVKEITEAVTRAKDRLVSHNDSGLLRSLDCRISLLPLESGRYLAKLILEQAKDGLGSGAEDVVREILKYIGTPRCPNDWLLQWQVGVRYLSGSNWLSVNLAALYAIKRLQHVSPVNAEDGAPGWKSDILRLQQSTAEEVRSLA